MIAESVLRFRPDGLVGPRVVGERPVVGGWCGGGVYLLVDTVHYADHDDVRNKREEELEQGGEIVALSNNVAFPHQYPKLLDG